MSNAVTRPTLVELWGGWSIRLPAARYQRNEDGSWSAWGEDWTIDIHIIETAGDNRGRPVSAEQILGEADDNERIVGKGWIGTTQMLIEKDNGRDVYRLAGRLGAENTLMSCWVSCVRQDQQSFAEGVMQGISHERARAV